VNNIDIYLLNGILMSIYLAHLPAFLRKSNNECYFCSVGAIFVPGRNWTEIILPRKYLRKPLHLKMGIARWVWHTKERRRTTSLRSYEPLFGTFRGPEHLSDKPYIKQDSVYPKGEVLLDVDTE
jgi:hypothetical protein